MTTPMRRQDGVMTLRGAGSHRTAFPGSRCACKLWPTVLLALWLAPGLCVPPAARAATRAGELATKMGEVVDATAAGELRHASAAAGALAADPVPPASPAGTDDFSDPFYYDHFTVTTLATSQRFADAQLKRLRGLRLERGQLHRSVSPGEKGTSVWLDLYGGEGDQVPDEGFDGYENDYLGGALGIDRRLGEEGFAGVSVGSSRAGVAVDEGGGTGEIQSLFAAIYGSHSFAGRYFDLAVTYGNHDYDNERLVRLPAVDWLASSQHDGDTWSAHIETGYRHEMGRWLVQPYLALNYIYLREKAFSEEGAAQRSLEVGERKSDSLVSDLGARLSRVFTMSTGFIAAELSGSWNYHFDVDDRTFSAGLAGDPDATFSITGREPSWSGLLLGASLSAAGNSGLGFSLKLGGEWRENYQSFGAIGGIEYQF